MLFLQFIYHSRDIFSFCRLNWYLTAAVYSLLLLMDY
uniref:Uncharacterized protein n=1 Tax=Rhizophora mucronata TaxID=61149 RepID=A0A2P2JM23_RHIMU